MAATTPFLNLYKPGGGSTGLIVPDEVVDVDRFNANSDLIDTWAQTTDTFRLAQLTRGQQYRGLAANIGAVPSPQRGDTYQETDGSFLLWTYNGTTWVGGPATLVPSAGITLAHRVHRIGNIVVFNLDASKATDMTANETVTTLPAEFRPLKDMSGGLHLGSGFGVINTWGSVLTTGEVRVNAIGVAGVRNAFFSLTWVRDS